MRLRDRRSGLTRMLTGARAPVGHGHLAQHLELGFALDVEAADAGLAAPARISARVLPTPEKMMSRRLGADGQHALEFAARDDVEAAAGLREHLQHAERGVGLHRVADHRLAAREAALVGGQRVEHRWPSNRRTAACRARAPSFGQRATSSTCSSPPLATRRGDGRAGGGHGVRTGGRGAGAGAAGGTVGHRRRTAGSACRAAATCGSVARFGRGRIGGQVQRALLAAGRQASRATRPARTRGQARCTRIWRTLATSRNCNDRPRVPGPRRSAAGARSRRAATASTTTTDADIDNQRVGGMVTLTLPERQPDHRQPAEAAAARSGWRRGPAASTTGTTAARGSTPRATASSSPT